MVQHKSLSKTASEKSKAKLVKALKGVLGGTRVEEWKLTGVVLDKLYGSSVKELVDGAGNIRVNYKDVDLTLPYADKAIAPSILNGYFESNELDMLKEISKESSCFFDVGANIGLYSLVAAKSNPRLNVYSFEPIKSNIGLLDTNIANNECQRQVKVVKTAVGDRNGYIEIYVSEISSIHSVSKEHSRGNTTEKVKLTSLDYFANSKKLSPDLVKIDIEGYDTYALKGAGAIFKAKPTIFIEYDKKTLIECDSDPKDFVNILFQTHKHVYAFNKNGKGITKVTKKYLLENTTHGHLNLLAVSNPNHLRIIKKLK